MRKLVANSFVVSSVFLFAVSNAQQICPAGYSDGDKVSENHSISVTFQGKTYNCQQTRYGRSVSVIQFAVCSDRIRLGSSPDMEVFVKSQEGIEYRFFENDHSPRTKTKDCSRLPYCTTRSQHTNYARYDKVNFTVPITTVIEITTSCNKVSF